MTMRVLALAITMRPTALLSPFCAAMLASGCSTVVYHVAEPAPDVAGIFILHPDGSDTSAGPAYANGGYPHVSADGSVLFVKRFPSGASQVFRGAQQLTDSAGEKRHPTSSPTAVAYVHVIPGGGPHIVVRSNAGADQLLLASNATGLAFYDNGSKLVYTQYDGVYSTPSSGNGTPTRVAGCASTTPPSGCGPLAVSHNGQYLAYYTYVTFAAQTVEYIQVSRIGTWQPILRISPRDFCPTCVDGAAGTPEQLGSFDFSPDDEYLYTTVRVVGPGTGPAAKNRDELFRLKLNLTDASPTISAPERLTNNTYPDYHPSTRLRSLFW